MLKLRLMGELPPVERQLRALGFGALYATLFAAVIDASAVPFETYLAQPPLLAQIPALSLLEACDVFLPNLGLLALLTLCALQPQSRLITKLLPWLGVLGAVGNALWTLTRYEKFAAQIAVWVVFGGLFLGLGYWVSRQRLHTWAASEGWLRRWGIALLALLGAAAAYAKCASMHVDDYPTMRLSLTQCGHLLTALALCSLAGLLPLALLRRVSTPWIALLIGGSALALQASGATAAARPHFMALTTLGTSHTVFRAYAPGSEEVALPVPDDPAGVTRFLKNSGLPMLPPGFDLTQYNVLFILSEATRFDQTSLANPALATTPELAKFAQGSLYFTRAYSPSSGTMLALSGILGMTYPSMLKVETWQKPWLGEWLEPERNAAVLFSAAGIETFWITHNHGGSFSKVLLGLTEGFKDRTLVPELGPTEPDVRIADAVIDKLQDLAASHERFFGLVFFESPHAPYVQHRPGPDLRDSFANYKQELAFMDIQLGRVVRALDETGLSDRTVVVFTGDHGEEFRDHGGRYHMATVYSECVNVPLVVRVPGLEPQALNKPTSSMYVLPWLMLNGSPAMRVAVEQILRHEIGPMLQYTEGAVISEVLGHDRIKSTLVYPSIKINYDFVAERHEVYQIDRDPREEHDLFASDSLLASKSVRRVAAYRQVRAARRKFMLRADKLDPRD